MRILLIYVSQKDNSNLIQPYVLWHILNLQYFNRHNQAKINDKEYIQKQFEKFLLKFSKNQKKLYLILANVKNFQQNHCHKKIDLNSQYYQNINNDIYQQLFQKQTQLVKNYHFSKQQFTRNKSYPLYSITGFLMLRNRIIKHQKAQAKTSLNLKHVQSQIIIKRVALFYYITQLHNEQILRKKQEKLILNINKTKQLSQLEIDDLKNQQQTDCLKDMYSQEKQYIQHIKQKNTIQRLKSIEKFQSHNIQPQSEKNLIKRILCQVCNSDQDNDKNLIVYCSLCFISCHQQCIGLIELPKDDWICQNCTKFGYDGAYVQCMLCSQKGGVMYETDVPVSNFLVQAVNQQYFKDMNQNEKTEDNFYQKYEKQIKNNYDQMRHEILTDTEMKFLKFFKDIENKNQIRVLYKSFAKDYNEMNQEINQQPITKNVWLHYSCAFWNGVKYKHQSFKNIFNFPKNSKRCQICLKTQGNCLQCYQNHCNWRFHVECARRVELPMLEQYDKPNFIIFCPYHMPIYLTQYFKKCLETQKNQIQKFYNNLNFYYENCKFQKIDHKLNLKSLYKKFIKYIQYYPEELKEFPWKYQLVYIQVDQFLKENYQSGIIINLKKQHKSQKYYYQNFIQDKTNFYIQLIKKDNFYFWDRIQKILGIKKSKIKKKFFKVFKILNAKKLYQNVMAKSQKQKGCCFNCSKLFFVKKIKQRDQYELCKQCDENLNLLKQKFLIECKQDTNDSFILIRKQLENHDEEVESKNKTKQKFLQDEEQFDSKSTRFFLNQEQSAHQNDQQFIIKIVKNKNYICLNNQESLFT